MKNETDKQVWGIARSLLIKESDAKFGIAIQYWRHEEKRVVFRSKELAELATNTIKASLQGDAIMLYGAVPCKIEAGDEISEGVESCTMFSMLGHNED